MSEARGFLDTRFRVINFVGGVCRKLHMKKPTWERREWNRRHARRLNKRRLDHRDYIKHRALQGISKNSRIYPAAPAETHIECPSVLSLEDNLAGTVGLLEAIRQQSKTGRPAYVDFRPIRKLAPTAALVLVAELYRWNRILSQKGRRLRARDVPAWDPEVRRLLRGMGFFDLLEVNDPDFDDVYRESTVREIQFVKYRTGKLADGKTINDLTEEDLEPVFGAVPSKHHLYSAIAEAMTNVVHHAYEDNAFCPNWWLSATHYADGSVSVMIYDQGMGIPASLPKRFAEYFKEAFEDAQLIEAAHDLARTASRESHRGHGLQRDVRKYLGVSEM